MTAARVGRLGGAVVLLASGTYFFVYLWRWEWNRAVVAGVIFLAAEIGLATAAVLDRLRRVTAAPDPEVLDNLRRSAPPAHDHFDWLSPRRGQTGVFVPVLLGMGVVVSALAWAVERLARATATPVFERRLAAQLGAMSWPSGGLLHGDGDGDRDREWPDLLTRPVRR